ncbi:MAG: PmoA family protein, partial [Pseudonocardia sp.]|nr:PmoA family protein [Pseudonocardia sp.]
MRFGRTTVAEYVDGVGLDPVLVPRPHLHPLRTLGGTVMTAAQPADHRWHLGLSVAVPDVAGCNFWGGPTFLREQGYTLQADHGRIEHT